MKRLVEVWKRRYWHARYAFTNWLHGYANHNRWYPPELAKACEDDSWDYALQLRDGTIWQFQGATALSREWVRISMHDHGGAIHGDLPHRRSFIFERGVCVRVADIVWIADAPSGS